MLVELLSIMQGTTLWSSELLRQPLDPCAYEEAAIEVMFAYQDILRGAFLYFTKVRFDQ